MAARGSSASVTYLGIVIVALGTLGPPARPDAKPSDEPARAFLAQHCQACHAGDKPKGKFRLDSLTQNFSDKANRERWLAVSEQVKSGAMPPKEKPRPLQKDVASLTDWIHRSVETAERTRNAAQGRVPIRRLNRAEYENTCVTCWA